MLPRLVQLMTLRDTAPRLAQATRDRDVGHLGCPFDDSPRVRRCVCAGAGDNDGNFRPKAPMTDPPPKTSPASSYAVLNGGSTEHAPAPTAATPRPDDETALLAAETERLGSLKGALWASFQAAPMSPIRAPIVDLTIAYTDALRLELKLRAAGKEQRSAAAKALAKSGVRAL